MLILETLIEALIKLLKLCNVFYFYFSPQTNCITNVLSKYEVFKTFLLEDCKQNGHGILVNTCESGECNYWIEKLSEVIDYVTKLDIWIDKKIAFTRFEYTYIENTGKRRIKADTTPLNLVCVINYLASKYTKFIPHSNQAKRDYILWNKYTENIDFHVASLVTVDYSEHLSIPIQREPRSLYWTCKANINYEWNWKF